MSVLLYAVVTSRERAPRMAGVRGERLRLVTSDRLGAVVGNMTTAPKPTATVLRAYHDLIGEIAGRTSAILPARFGTLLDDDELTFVLKSRAAAFLRGLTHVRGRVQMTVRIVGVTRRRPPGDAIEPPAASGRAYLHARAASQRVLHELAECRAVRREVVRWLRDERVERHDAVVTMYHLVPRRAAAAYRRALDAMTLTSPATVHVTGPFPPFAFADPLGIQAVNFPTSTPPRRSSQGQHG